MNDLQIIFYALIGISHQIAGTIAPIAYCWQAMDFHRLMGSIAALGALYALTGALLERIRQRGDNQPPLACDLPGPVEYLDNMSGRYQLALRQRGDVL